MWHPYNLDPIQGGLHVLSESILFVFLLRICNMFFVSKKINLHYQTRMKMLRAFGQFLPPFCTVQHVRGGFMSNGIQFAWRLLYIALPNSESFLTPTCLYSSVCHAHKHAGDMDDLMGAFENSTSRVLFQDRKTLDVNLSMWRTLIVLTLTEIYKFDRWKNDAMWCINMF